MGPASEEEFLNLSLFEAFDREHAAMIAAGLSTRWPEEAAEEAAWRAEQMRRILQGRGTAAKPTKGK